jgi:hypothetical protein
MSYVIANEITSYTATPVKQKKEADPNRLRGYCRVCNRYYFVKNSMQTISLQVHQHHGGVCQERRYVCARIGACEAWGEE